MGNVAVSNSKFTALCFGAATLQIASTKPTKMIQILNQALMTAVMMKKMMGFRI